MSIVDIDATFKENRASTDGTGQHKKYIGNKLYVLAPCRVSFVFEECQQTAQKFQWAIGMYVIFEYFNKLLKNPIFIFIIFFFKLFIFYMI